MKKKIIITLLACTAPALVSLAQGSSDAIHSILQQIETNNKTLQANHQLTTAQKADNKSSNNLSNPSVSYARLWDSKDHNKTVGEMVVSQGFDFPTLYVTRARMNRFKAQALDAQATALRQDILLQAHELCLDIIYLYQQQQLLNERLQQAEELASFYQKRLENGDANILETNKIKLELLNVRTESRTNSLALRSKMKDLLVLNGNQPLNPGRPLMEGNIPQPTAWGLTAYPLVTLPDNFGPLCQELLSADPSLQALNQENEANRKLVSVSKQGWLPKLEVGYRRNTESGHPLNGMVVGMSFPIFENRSKVKSAKAQAMSSSYQKENATLQASANLWQLYEEANSLYHSMKEYQEAFGQQQDLRLLKQALLGGEISMIEYFVEVAVIYQSHNNLLQVENQYQKTMARIYKSRL